MKMDVVAGSGNDEFYTPKYAIKPLLKYIDDKKYKNIICPFDTKQSNYYKVFTDHGLTVETSHLSENIDFFNRSYGDCDVIISNPPYSKKAEVFEHLFKIGKPFAMLVGVVGIFESERRFNMFKNNNFEIMYFDKRISFFKNYDDQKPSLNPPFSTVYICKDLLGNRIKFENINKKDT